MNSPRKIKKVNIGGIVIGGGEPVRVQTMTTFPTKNIPKVLSQIEDCRKAGAEIIRVSVLDAGDADSIKEIKKKAGIPIVADIHYNYRLAVASLENGADKLRINPGNLGGRENLQRVCESAQKFQKPIRVGVNAGSLEKEFSLHGGATPEALAESAFKNVRILEEMGFYDIVVSIKANDVERTVQANKLFRREFEYPLHLGVTEAGTERSGTIKHSMAFYDLLKSGTGETIRVSLSCDPVREVMVGWDILRILGLRKRGIELVSCPTCGRKNIDVFSLAGRLEDSFRHVQDCIKIAVMGCPVNGVDESRHADIGVCGIAHKKAVLWYRGNKEITLSEEDIPGYIKKYIDRYIKEK